ncbi:MAG TPA: c-type cytochrome [Steroidobacteraceae bacterium]
MLSDGKPWATLALAAGMLGGGSASALASGDGQDFARIERGRYLTIAADCAACHTDPASNQPFAGGRPIPTPFGIVIAANITPDRDTGIGTWTDAQFDAAVRGGRMPNGKRLYPAMPFPYYAHMSRADVGAIRAYLNTVQAVHHPVVSDQLPFPFSIRASMWLWDALYFTPGEFKPDPSQSGQWNRGAYLVEGPGHCASCHTPKTLLGGDKSGQAFRGSLVQGWFGPDITDDAQRGISNWTVADIVDYLKKGHNRYAGATGPMAEEVSDSSSKMTPDDLQDIATFLKSQPGQNAGATPVSPHDPAMVAGAAIYGDLCSACHKGDGTGVPFLIPSLAASDSVASRDPTSVLRVVLGGAQSVATDEEPTAPGMPGFGRDLNDAQVAAVATYVRNSWGHAAASVSDGDVGRVRKSLAVAQR